MEDYSKQIQEQATEVFDFMRDRVSAEDMRRMRKAFEFAAEAHKD